MRKNIAAVINPVSGGANAKRMWAEAEEAFVALGAECRIFETSAAGDARRITRGEAKNFEVIAAVGGDGTVNEVLNGIIDSGSSTPLAVFPCGTANVVAKEMRLPSSFAELADIAVNGEVHALDAAGAGEQRFVMCAGVGLDAEVVRRLHSMRTKSGISMLSYAGPIFEALREYRFPKITVRVDRQVVCEDATMVVVGNMLRYGGPFRIFHDASPSDGMLDVCCLKGSGMSFLPFAAASAMHVLHRYPGVFYARGREVDIYSEAEDVPVQLDGDPVGVLPQTIRVEPAAVGICCRGCT